MAGDGSLTARPPGAVEPEQPSLFPMEARTPTEHPQDPEPQARKRVRLRVVSQPTLPIALDPDLEEWIVEAAKHQPHTRGECDRIVWQDGGAAPCPFVSCKMHMWSDALEDAEVDDGTGLPRRMRQFEHMVETLDPEDWGETCALRIAESVVPEASATGKWEGHSVDGEPVGTPGPSFDASRQEWVAVEPEFASPCKVDAAVIGRFLGGLSREQIRKDFNRAAAVLFDDEACRQWARDRGRDPDQLGEIDGDDD